MSATTIVHTTTTTTTTTPAIATAATRAEVNTTIFNNQHIRHNHVAGVNENYCRHATGENFNHENEQRLQEYSKQRHDDEKVNKRRKLRLNGANSGGCGGTAVKIVTKTTKAATLVGGSAIKMATACAGEHNCDSNNEHNYINNNNNKSTEQRTYHGTQRNHKNRHNNRKFHRSRPTRPTAGKGPPTTLTAAQRPTAAVMTAFRDMCGAQMSSASHAYSQPADGSGTLLSLATTAPPSAVPGATAKSRILRSGAARLLTSLLLHSSIMSTLASLVAALTEAAVSAEAAHFSLNVSATALAGNGSQTALAGLELLTGGAGAGSGSGAGAVGVVNGGKATVGASSGVGMSNRDISFNDSDDLIDDEDTEYVFDRTDVRIIFITLYTLVFCCCFFGNLLVILVVTLSRRLRSITNFFLANLALADFCVGLFCVMQNLSIYLIDSWVFGEFLCRMYQFVHSLSYTASIFILVVICMERYFAIVHPITCKQILTAARLRMVILTVWITSAVYSTPKFVFSKTIKNIHTEDGQEEEICVLDRKMFNSKLLDMINFGLLYVIPLLVMTVLYSKIAIALWRSSHGLTHHLAAQQQQQQHQQQDNSLGMHNSMYHHNHHHHHQHLHHSDNLPAHSGSVNLNNHHAHNHLQQTQGGPQQQQQPPGTPLSGSLVGGGGGGLLTRKQSSKYEKRGVSITESQFDDSQVSLDSERPIVSACRQNSSNSHKHSFIHHHTSGHQQRPRVAHMSHSSNNVLRARRGVVRMLIIFVLTFALCNLPYHARKMWQYWSRSYRGDSNFNALLTPLTFLVTYFNSGVNPLLYAFLSRNFRKGMKELLLCSWKKGKGKSSSNSSMHHKRMALQTHSLPTDTTHIGNEQL